MSIRPYILYKNEERNTLRRVVVNALTQWSSEWVSDNQDIDVEAIELSTSLNEETELKANRNILEFTQIKLDENRWGVFEISAENKILLASLFLKESLENSKRQQPGIIIDELFKHALRNLLERLLAKKSDHAGTTIKSLVDIPDSAYRTGSGSLMFHVSFAEIEFRLILSGSILFEHISEQRKSAYRKGGLNTLGEACASHVVPINLRLGTAEVKLADVMTLEVGDVLTLDQKITDPAKLVVSGETVEHQCMLGKVGERKAVRLLAK